jgi:CRISPR-associated endonuclease/helicase Cas3
VKNCNNDLIISGLLEKALGLAEGETAFPWQEELLRRFLKGVIPPALDIPTGLGKTAVMAIWLVARASGAKLPRRLVYVVDRRAVVDQATEVAIALREFVGNHPALKTGLGLGTDRSLPISTLRGQHVDNREWLEDPCSPAIVVGTVDMIGSRLLFEGYGVSRKMRPYHAGLLGADTLAVLDEAHLVPPFERLLQSIAERDADFRPRDEALNRSVPRFKLLSLSATGRDVGNESLGLTDADLNHPVLNKRLHATKRLFMKPIGSASNGDPTANVTNQDHEMKWSLSDALSREAWTLAQNGARKARIIVFCNSRKVAGDTKIAVEKLAKGDNKAGTGSAAISTELFVGGRRVFEREQAKERLVDLGFIVGSERVPDRPVFLFATSAAEVGVNLDADHMVCDLVAWERMVQRLGRVNRRGGDNRMATIMVVAEPEPKDIDQLLDKMPADRSKKEASMVEQVERARAVRRVLEQLPSLDGTRAASPGALRDLRQRAESDETLRQLLDDASTPAPLRPALTRPLVEAWSMTSLKDHTGRPTIDPWLRGWIDDDPQTAVVWRTYLPVRSGPKEPTKGEIEAFFEAALPHTSEILETETFRVVQWLEERAAVMQKQAKERQEDATTRPLPPAPDEVVAFVLSRAGDLRRSLRLKELTTTDDGDSRSARQELLREILSGATIVVDARLAGLKDGLLDEKEDSLPRTADDGQEWLGEHVTGFRIRCVDVDKPVAPDPSWRERLRFASDVSEEGEPRRWLLVEKWRHEAATEEDRSSAHPQLLNEHQSWAEERARILARRLRLDDQYIEMLAVAARLHDEGKRARRWQRAFNAPPDGLYAKTKGPINYALLDGYRHELGSIPFAESNDVLKSLPEEVRDLALHLIASHHGFGRPIIGTRGCADAPPSIVEMRARDVALRFARLQRRWGPWGLAWWEALLRAVDQQVSRDNDIAEAARQKEVI